MPIVVDGEVWGLIRAATTGPEPLPADIEASLRDYTELVATAISKTESRDSLRRVVAEQAALRSVATLVAEGAAPAEVFSSVAQEVARIIDVSAVSIVRFESDTWSVVVASVNDSGFPVGSRWPLQGPSLNATVFETGKPAQIDYSELPGPVAVAARSAGVRVGVGVPIVVEGSVWGMIAVGQRHRRDALPAFAGSYTGRIVLSTASPRETQERLAAFTELVATAISKAQAHDDLRELAMEQAALRRVATLVAGAASPDETLAAVAEEVAHLFGLPRIEMVRYEGDGAGVVIGASGDHPFPVGSRWALDGPSIMASVLETGRPARIDDYETLPGTIAEVARGAGFRSAIGAPIIVDGHTWGTIIAISTMPDPIPEGAEIRLSKFTELVATAVSNLQARDDLRGLADEQAALRRVATLVAEGATPEVLFSAVAREAAQVLDVAAASLERYEADGTGVTLALARAPDWEIADSVAYPGRRWPYDPGGLLALVWDTGRAARVDDYSEVGGAAGEAARAVGVTSACAAPITVDGKLWGLIRVYARQGKLPEGTESRLSLFTELVATALSNAAARAEVVASRARIVAAGDEARRRIERNLHDGAQQRLIALGLDLQRIRTTIHDDRQAADLGLERAGRDLESVLEEMRELSRGLHPALLSRGGLGPSLRALARKSPIHVDLNVNVEERPPASVETAVYYIVSEALTNAIKHSDASSIAVAVAADDALLHATISDDGVGGAVADTGSGLTGLGDRVEALGGRFGLESPPGRGTTISVELPIATPATP